MFLRIKLSVKMICCLKMLVLMWLLIWSYSKSQDMPFMEREEILSNAKYLCPHTSFCEEPPLSSMPLPPGKVPCCRDCSCKQDCMKYNDCCFPYETKMNTARSECMYPSVQQVPFLLLRNVFKIVVDVINCTPYLKINESPDNNTKLSPNNFTPNSCRCADRNGTTFDQCWSEGTKCGKCQCYKDEEVPMDDQMATFILCDRPINTKDGCSCGDVKIAPWGSMYPVFSKTTGLIYKNSVCAACHGVNDSADWTPVIHCKGKDFKDIKNVLAAPEENDCFIRFKEPETVENSLLPICLDGHSCESNVLIPYGLNMSVEKIADACRSNFNSLYKDKRENVFCAVCSNFYDENTRTCGKDNQIKSIKGIITFLLKHEFMKEAANKAVRNHPTVCSSKRPSDCREILCPLGQLRDTIGVCRYPMSATYISGYGIALRLIPDKQIYPASFQTLISERKLRFEHFISPWARTWKCTMVAYESSRLMPSGGLKNVTAFIVQMLLLNPVKNQTRVFNDIWHRIKQKWTVKVQNYSVTFKSEFLEYKGIVHDISRDIFKPVGLQGLEEIFPIPHWQSVHFIRWSQIENLSKSSIMTVTKLMFCDQVVLVPQFDAYTLLPRNRVLYFKSQNKYIYDGNFVFDKNGQHKLRLCIEDTDFSKPLSSLSTRTAANILALICVWMMTLI